MSGSLQKKGTDYWLLRVSTGKDPMTGKYRQATKTFRGKKADAKKALDSYADAVSKGKHTLTSATLATIIDRWIRATGPELSPTTLNRYEGIIKQHIQPALGNVPVSRIKPHLLNDFYQSLLKDKKQKPATVRQTHAIIRRALGYAVEEEWLSINPAANAKPPKVESREVDPPTLEQLRAFGTYLAQRNPDLAVFVFLSFMLGTRRGELCGLRWSDIDFRRGEITIARSVYVVKRQVAVKSTKTHASRTFTIEDAIMEQIRNYYDAVTDRANLLGMELAPEAYVFSNDGDGENPWQPVSVTSAFRYAAKECGLVGVRLHDLRHFSVANEVAMGIDPKTVASRHGHKDPTMTLKVYSHFLPAADKQAAILKGSLLNEQKELPEITS